MHQSDYELHDYSYGDLVQVETTTHRGLYQVSAVMEDIIYLSKVSGEGFPKTNLGILYGYSPHVIISAKSLKKISKKIDSKLSKVLF